MSMLPVLKSFVSADGKTKQKVGVEHDINKLVAKYKRTGSMPSLNYDGSNLSDDGEVIDLTTVGDFQECQNRIAVANEVFDRYPSLHEGWGISVIEANAYKTPSIGFKVPGLSDSIVDGTTGYLCNDEEDMVAKVS